MKKLFTYLFVTFLLLWPLAAQEDASSGNTSTEEVNEQYETFSWEPVAKAKQYEVTIEKHDPITDAWSEYKTVKTNQTQMEILFTPGSYRVSIATYNLIGRKGKASDWVTFKILEEHIPYLNERFLPKNSEWNAPVLFIKHNNSETPGTDGDSDSLDYIRAPSGFTSNTILIKP